jgi:hypothetical protein
LLQAGNYWWIGLASMAIYLLFWAVVIVFYPNGEIDAEEFEKMKEDLE